MEIADIIQKLNQDSSYLSHFKLSRKLKKQPPTLTHQVKVAVLSAFTLDPLQPCLSVQCAQHNINCELYQGAYAQYQQEILNPDSALYQFEADLTLLLVDTPALFPELWQTPYQVSAQQRQQSIDQNLSAYTQLISQLRQNSQGLLVVCNFIPPRFSEMGILERQQANNVRHLLEQANQTLQQHINQQTDSYVLDLAHLAFDVGLAQVYDPKLANYGDIRFSMDFIATVSQHLMGYLLPLKGLIKKCLVLDCDNTLWGGVVGEDGWQQVKIGSDTVEGRAFSQFQQLLLRYQQRGFILAINSKNNEQDALEVFKNRPEMILKPEHFAVMRINWQDKAQNLREIAEQLNIGLDSLVFFDDSPQERAVIREYLPQVLVPEMPQPDGYAALLGSLIELNVLNFTNEDSNKAAMYAQQASRNQSQAQATDLSSYLHSLETVATIIQATPAQYPRLAQLSQKTNQFNLTTKRYSEADIQQFAESEQALVYSLSVKDKFGDLGIVGLAIWTQLEDPAHWLLDSLLLSCRCLGRQAEDAFLGQQLNELRDQGATLITAEYRPTPKNKPVKDFIDRLDWDNNHLQHHYKIDLNDYCLEIPSWITLK